MSTLTEPQKMPATAPEQPVRYQIYRQNRPGNYTAEFKSDSAVEIVEAFLTMRPAFEGGAMHIYNHWRQNIGASVEWAIDKTSFGFPVHTRKNIFPETLLGTIAQQLNERESLRVTNGIPV